MKNVPFFSITSEPVVRCCSHSMQVFLWPLIHSCMCTCIHTHVLTHGIRGHTYSQLLTATCADTNGRHHFSNTISSTRQLTNGQSSLSAHPQCLYSIFPPVLNCSTDLSRVIGCESHQRRHIEGPKNVKNCVILNAMCHCKHIQLP